MANDSWQVDMSRAIRLGGGNTYRVTSLGVRRRQCVFASNLTVLHCPILASFLEIMNE